MPEPHTAAEPFILFELAGTTYGVPSRLVQQMEKVEHITPVPNAPPFVEGLVFLRGQVVPAISLRARFGFPRVPHDVRTRLVVLHTDARTVGLVVDTAREFVRIPLSAIQPAPEAVPGTSDRYLEGIAELNGRLILILSVEAVLATPEDLGVPDEASAGVPAGGSG